jgi:hypothetical protein
MRRSSYVVMQSECCHHHVYTRQGMLRSCLVTSYSEQLIGVANCFMSLHTTRLKVVLPNPYSSHSIHWFCQTALHHRQRSKGRIMSHANENRKASLYPSQPLTLADSPMRQHQYANTPDIDFDTAESEKPTQVIDLIDSKDPVEYPVP